MNISEKSAPAAAIVAALSTLACCVPLGFLGAVGLGLSEETAMQSGLRVRKNHAQIGGWYSSRRVAEKTAAFKVLIEEGSDRILGAHLLGPAAEETINLFALAMREGMTAEGLKGGPVLVSDTRLGCTVHALKRSLTQDSQRLRVS